MTVRVWYPSATAASPCQTCYLSSDHLGSLRLVTDQSGNVIARHDFLPYGEETTVGRNGQWGSNDNINQKFTGQIRDPETGEDYFNARMFGSALGRFTIPDPGNAGADLYNPQSWNGYAYAGGNPMVNIDPSGQSFLSIFKKIAGAIAIGFSVLSGFGVAWAAPIAQVAGLLTGSAGVGGIVSDYSIKSGNPAPYSEQIPVSSVSNPGRFIYNATSSTAIGNSSFGMVGTLFPISFNSFPTDPSGVGPQWTKDNKHRDPNGTRWTNPQGWELEWNKGRPGMNGWRGKDHWHVTDPGDPGSRDRHYEPGDHGPVPIGPDPVKLVIDNLRNNLRTVVNNPQMFVPPPTWTPPLWQW